MIRCDLQQDKAPELHAGVDQDEAGHIGACLHEQGRRDDPQGAHVARPRVDGLLLRPGNVRDAECLPKSVCLLTGLHALPGAVAPLSTRDQHQAGAALRARQHGRLPGTKRCFQCVRDAAWE